MGVPASANMMMASSGIHDPYFNDVVLLLPLTGSNGSQAFTDVIGNTVTVSGTPAINTSSAKFPGGSAYFDGSTGYLSVASSTSLNMGTSDFAIEFWMNQASADDQNYRTPVSKYDGSSTGWFIHVNSSGVLLAGATNTLYGTGTHTVADGTWHFIQLMRSSGNVTVGVDGVSDITFTASASYDNTAPWYLGQMSGLTRPYKGYIQDLRITKGYARSLANPSAPFPTH
ncbi:MAG: LamG domain-containing protein [Alphaproteobacteria bacterium]|nr:LamG domain-containing protein [Alphaproteobacteria bacterium]